MIRAKQIYWINASLLISLPCICLWATESIAAESIVVFLVRHAEKVDSSRDPELSAAGLDRAKRLANALRTVKLDSIHSSDYIRTRSTAAPTAEHHKLKVELYDPDGLSSLVKKLRQTKGRHLVVGHSNTTPAVVKLLGGDPGKPIDEAGEYDRLYIVTVSSSGEVSTVLMRYGKPFKTPGAGP